MLHSLANEVDLPFIHSQDRKNCITYLFQEVSANYFSFSVMISDSVGKTINHLLFMTAHTPKPGRTVSQPTLFLKITNTFPSFLSNGFKDFAI